MIPARYAPILYGFFLSCMMSLIISGVATVRTTGLIAAFPQFWLNAWLSSWVVAFPIVLFVGPFARRIVGRLTR